MKKDKATLEFVHGKMKITAKDEKWIPVIERLVEVVGRLESLALVRNMCTMAVEEMQERKTHSHEINLFLDDITVAKQCAKSLAEAVVRFRLKMNEELRSYVGFALDAGAEEALINKEYDQVIYWADLALDIMQEKDKIHEDEDLYDRAIALHDGAMTHLSKVRGYGYGLYILTLLVLFVLWVVIYQFGLLDYISIKLHSSAMTK